jgi:N6-adenosine-specific RNA methylase IME4/ParB-like chromosome segregation protein Spo0J
VKIIQRTMMSENMNQTTTAHGGSVHPEGEFHPFADIFPLMEGAEFDALVADIKANGLHESIVLLEGKILDGRNRYRACLAAGIEPSFRPFQGDDPVAFVISLNIARRHLNESQRAMVAAKLATLRRGDNQHSPIGETSQARAAELLNVGKRTVERAAEVRDHGAPELRHAVERGAVSLAAAADVATLPATEQAEIVARGEKEILLAAKAIRAKRVERNHAERMERIREISAGNRDLPGGSYAIIYADPPWHFEVYDETSGIERAVGNHYPCMATADICAMPVPELTTPDAVLFMWTTSPHLPEALQVIEAWGFEYKSNAVWVKDKLGLGYYVRNRHELLLIATKGNMPAPLPASRPDSVIEAPRMEHSAKPDEAYELIERMYPDLPRIELFSRSPRPGWVVWGNQSGEPDDDLAIPEFLRRRR